MKCSDLESCVQEAYSRCELLAGLFDDMKFSYEHLKRNKEGLMKSVILCLTKIVESMDN